MDTYKNINKKTLVFLLSIALGFIVLIYQSGLLILWLEDEEYGHGLMVIGLLSYIVYERWETIAEESIKHAWLGILFSIVALFLSILSGISGIDTLQMYSIWVFAIALSFAFGGIELFKKMLVPLGIILLLIPLPGIIGPLLTAELQMISSKIGVWVIRLFGGIVYLEGNVIDMGGVKLLVAEACAGLRYLFPLMSIGAIAGYLMQAQVWIRWTIFLSTIPITIFMNSFRIGITGLLTEAYGTSHTEGFLHFFEGWVVFVASLIILVVIAWLLIKMVPGSPPISRVFSISLINNEKGKVVPKENNNWHSKSSVVTMLLCIVIAVAISSPLVQREETIVNSKPFTQFPSMLGKWIASESRLPPSVEAVAGASEYYYGDFSSSSDSKINLYIAYYKDQKQGAAPHSPKVCIPGDGWVIKSDEPVIIKSKSGKEFEVSRLLISKGKHSIVTYYWLKQGENVFRKQIVARLNLIWFTIKENRADAALVRMVSEVAANEKVQDADDRLQHMASELLGVIDEYVPD